MRTLSGALLAAQKSGTARPYVRVEVMDVLGGAARFTWERLYGGTEPDGHHDATMPGDGSLVRIRGSGDIYRQRVADPGPGSDFSQWHYWGFTGSDVALCSHGAEVLAFWVQSSGWLRRRESSTCGETWGDPIHMDYLGGDYGSYRVAACFKPNGDALVLYSNGVTLQRRRRLGGTWEEPATWSNTLQSVTGIAVVHSGDWNVVVTGVDGGGRPGAWSCLLGDGYGMPADSWSDLKDITAASPGSETGFHAPSLDMPDVFRAFFVERYSGTEAYARPCWCHSPANADYISNLWREPVPFDLCCDYGVALAHGGGYTWLCAPYGVWRAATTPAPVDLSDDVIALTSRLRPFSGELEATLRNDDGRFNALSSGAYGALRMGSMIRLYAGYHTDEGPRSSPAGAFRVQGWDYLTTPRGTSNLVLHGGDGWSLLQRWRARRQFTWQHGQRNIFQLLQFLLARAGLAFSSLSYSDAIFQAPAFTIHPGETALAAVQRLLELVPDVIRFDGDTACLMHPQADDASTYSYGTDHAVLAGRYGRRLPGCNRVQAFGDGLFTEDWDWESVEKVHDRLAQVKDLNLKTAAEAHERGQATLRRSAMETVDDHIAVPMNCGQELYDVVDISRPQLGIAGATRRVMAMHCTWLPDRARYTLGLDLGAP